jgi:cytochrome c biogenesis protein CcmG/thiol:disulfide interchange protein DsbE
VSKIIPVIGVGAALACALLWTGCSDIGGMKPAPKAQQEQKPAGPFSLNAAVGQATPTFSLKDASGQLVRPVDYKGKVVLLDFWATWCGPCGIEIPWFTDFQRKYKDRGFTVLGVSMDDGGWKDVKPFVAENKINYQIVLGDDKTSDLYGDVEALPTTFVIDREGRIASVHVGLVDKKEFDDAIQKLL